ncbi:hypothetical protein ACWKWP_04560 [Agromyces soli]
MPLVAFLRSWAVIALGCLPLLALMLVPQLMRSRAGSESLLMAGVLGLFALLAAAVVAAPVLSAIGAPSPTNDAWMPRTALRATASVWRRRRGQAWLALGVFVLLYAGGQALGYAVGAAVPYVHDNPAFASDPDAPRWVIDYPAYALQALVLYACTTLALAVYATRIRALAVVSPPPARVDVSIRPSARAHTGKK